MLLTGSDLLKIAYEHNFAVPAFNVSSYSMLNALFDICEQKQAPHIIAIHPDELHHIGVDMLPAIVQRAHKSSVPTAIHLDHGASYEQVILAIQNGFTSVMIDKSLLPFDQNVEITKKIVEAAHAVGISVEAELGTIGKMDKYAESGTDDIIYTDPETAARFIEQTNADSLAVAIGTRHGIYPAELIAKLELNLLSEIKSKVHVPLVLHGGSDNPDDEIAEAVTRGINKINISSDIKVAYFMQMREVLQDIGLREPLIIEPPCEEALKIVAAAKIDLFQANGKANLY